MLPVLARRDRARLVLLVVVVTSLLIATVLARPPVHAASSKSWDLTERPEGLTTVEPERTIDTARVSVSDDGRATEVTATVTLLAKPTVETEALLVIGLSPFGVDGCDRDFGQVTEHAVATYGVDATAVREGRTITVTWSQAPGSLESWNCASARLEGVAGPPTTFDVVYSNLAQDQIHGDPGVFATIVDVQGTRVTPHRWTTLALRVLARSRVDVLTISGNGRQVKVQETVLRRRLSEGDLVTVLVRVRLEAQRGRTVALRVSASGPGLSTTSRRPVVLRPRR